MAKTKITKKLYGGEYDEELGRDPLFVSETTIDDLPDDIEIDDVVITYRTKRQDE